MEQNLPKDLPNGNLFNTGEFSPLVIANSNYAEAPGLENLPKCMGDLEAYVSLFSSTMWGVCQPTAYS